VVSTTQAPKTPRKPLYAHFRACLEPTHRQKNRAGGTFSKKLKNPLISKSKNSVFQKMRFKWVFSVVLGWGGVFVPFCF